MTVAAPVDRPVGGARKSVLAAYALPAIPLAALALPLYIIVPTFYADSFGLSLAAIGTVLLLIRLFDAVTDPLFGWLADRFNSRLGRRRGFFALSLPVTAIAAFMLFWPPDNAGIGYLALWGAAISVGYTWSVLPYTAWGAELATDYSGRARVAGWREGATLVGTLVAIALPFAIGLERGEGLDGMAAMALATLLLVPICGTAAIAFVPEPRNATKRRLRLGEGLRFIVRNRPFVRLVAAFLLNGAANAVPATLFLYFVSDRLGAEAQRGPLLFLYFLCGVAGVPLAIYAASRFGKHRAWCCAMIGACAIFLCAGFLGQGDIVPFAIICALTGLLLGFDLSLPAAIQADVIDYDTAGSGEQRSGTYFAVWSLATKLALALAVGIVFPVLALAGFEAGRTDPQPDGALFALSALYAWLPILPKLAAVALMWNFPLGEHEQKELRRRIDDDVERAT